jgi:hypothetical protein
MAFMRHLLSGSLRIIAITICIVVFAPGYAGAQVDAQRNSRPIMRRPIPAAALRGSSDFVRSELYFGTARPDGVVTDGEFFEFRTASSRRGSPTA